MKKKKFQDGMRKQDYEFDFPTQELIEYCNEKACALDSLVKNVHQSQKIKLKIEKIKENNKNKLKKILFKKKEKRSGTRVHTLTHTCIASR